MRVALRAVESARQAADTEGPGVRAAHVGHHLIGKGRRELEADVAWRPGPGKRLRRLAFAHATAAYLGSIALATAALVAVGVAYVRHEGGGTWPQLGVALLLLLPASEVAIALVQRLAVHLAPPRRLPRLDLSAGIPEDARTLVVVPTLLTSVEGVERQLEHLEVLALGNLDAHVHFAILGDFADAAARDLPEDGAILAAARSGIEALNARLGEERADRFFLFHRARQWNPAEDAWMGWERKRGKLEELNRVLRGATDTSYDVQVGELSVLPGVRYVITLDSDTRLPRDGAKKLVGVIAHPLNRPRLDPGSGRVVEGYGILQPRVSVTTASAAGSRFARIFAGHTGVDPYTTAVSDTYQDLFGEGSFTGKGLYDVDAFTAALEGRVPDNTLLSHDLFEGLGSGDWNDGMNLVGREGRGESVWLGFFLHAVLSEFAPLCTARGEEVRAGRCIAEAARLASALERAWDGEWYRRGYYDDGAPLGSAQGDECTIDSIAQSWAVLSGAAPPRLADRAMDSVRTHLVSRAAQVVLLLTPPFDRSTQQPGYIKGYPPGVRENGGQYTRAAAWIVMALAKLGSGDEAAELFHMLNPVNHTRTGPDVARYRGEPYVVAGDVCGRPEHAGRAGWTWYTGSAGWMYRAGLESILGLRRHGESLELDPCIPASWPEYAITWRFGRTRYEISVTNPERRCRGIAAARLDGAQVDPRAIALVDDGRTHELRVVLGSAVQRVA